MTDGEKARAALDALIRLHGLIYARTLHVGSADYFEARHLIVNTLKDAGELDGLNAKS